MFDQELLDDKLQNASSIDDLAAILFNAFSHNLSIDDDAIFELMDSLHVNADEVEDAVDFYCMQNGYVMSQTGKRWLYNLIY